MARGLRPSMEIAMTRSTALSAASSVGAVGAPVFLAAGEAGDSEGGTGAPAPAGRVAWHPAARKAPAIKAASHGVRRRRAVISSTLVVAGRARNVARQPSCAIGNSTVDARHATSGSGVRAISTMAMITAAAVARPNAVRPPRLSRVTAIRKQNTAKPSSPGTTPRSRARTPA
jgi:hypothetical protein